MATVLDKELKRQITIDGVDYTVAVDPEGIRLIGKGKRRPDVELRWRDLLSGEAALASATDKLVAKTVLMTDEVMTRSILTDYLPHFAEGGKSLCVSLENAPFQRAECERAANVGRRTRSSATKRRAARGARRSYGQLPN